MSMLQVTPDELRAVAGSLESFAAQIGQYAGGTNGALGNINWAGSTHKPIFEGQVSDIVSTMSQAQSQLSEAATGLRAYAARIDEAR